MITNIKIPIRAIAKQRPRLGRNGVVYTPTQTKVFENTIKFCYGNRYFYDKEYIKVSICFKFKVPKSYTKSQTREALEGKIRPTKADIDNYIKSILDGLNKVAWSDDRYITEIQATKIYHIEDEIEVTIENV